MADGDLFQTHSREELTSVVQTLLDRRYDTVFSGGGDGTFTSLVNELVAQVDERNKVHPTRAPKLGILKLGTGNGLAGLVKASPLKGDRILDDVLRARAGEVPGYRRVDLLSVNGRHAVFGGMGLDGRILNDFVWVKENLAKGALSFLSGEAGYVASLALRTIPNVLTQPSFTRARVVNGPEAAFKLAPDGSAVQEFAPGAVLFEGELNFVAAATTPFYGYELKMFPFAGMRPGFMQLRMSATTATQVLANLPRFWKGKWFADYIHDFHVRSAVVEVERPMPLQIGGDAEGYHQRLDLKVSGEPIELVDFSGAVH